MPDKVCFSKVSLSLASSLNMERDDQAKGAVYNTILFIRKILIYFWMRFCI